jgi:hypothetical protein
MYLQPKGDANDGDGTKAKLSLETLLKDCKPSQQHGETDFGIDVGKEIVE